MFIVMAGKKSGENLAIAQAWSAAGSEAPRRFGWKPGPMTTA